MVFGGIGSVDHSVAVPTHNAAAMLLRGRVVVPCSLLREVNAGVLLHLFSAATGPHWAYVSAVFGGAGGRG